MEGVPPSAPPSRTSPLLWVGVWGLGFGVADLGFGVWGCGFGVWGLEFGIWGLGSDLGFGVEGLRVQVLRLGVWVLGVMFRFLVSGFGIPLPSEEGTPIFFRDLRLKKAQAQAIIWL